MRAGISKCGVILCFPTKEEVESLEAGEEWGMGIEVQGQQVPVVMTYTYLGVPVTPWLDRQGIVDERLKQAKKKMAIMIKFLKHPLIASNVKVQLVRAVMIPSASYGAEIFGMNKTFTAKVQTVVNKALRLAVGCKADEAPSNVALWRETNVPPFCAIAAGLKARLLYKFPKLRTVGSTIMRTGLQTGKSYWQKMVRTYLRSLF